ncbi:hypothetical protein [Nonomuraea dietziae]|uniref:Uncharacterized protein n=1 Tax=Nonomuraea dietziae TaxID=65515 RepID=A0A7W5YBD6_9ACTN|nr:hypothetical protein [Nonomuraea dietziae]MBB3728063.1 hypothetical protein [Nonomuraea dietziae]
MKIDVSRVRLGRDEYRVLRPAVPPRHAFLHDDGWALSMHVDRAASRALADLWALATRSRRSLVHLPLRGNVAPEGVEAAEPLDLVLLHHAAQFPLSRWPAVRARLGKGRPQTARPAPLPASADYRRLHHREYRDLLRFDVAARTLFVTGGPESFVREGARLRSLVTDGPSRSLDAHFCVELDAGRASRTCSGRLHIEYVSAATLRRNWT